MGKFNFIKTKLPGMLIIEPKVFVVARGYFMETYTRRDFAEGGIDREFVQDNQSKSSRGVLRGMHFQKEHPQGKLVRVVSGKVFDVAVDCRPGSLAFGKWEGVVLSAENKRMLYIPEGFAHGFLVLSDEAEFTYKCTDYYAPGDEGGIPWNDPDVAVEWPDAGVELLTSEKDSLHPGFKAQTFDYFKRWAD